MFPETTVTHFDSALSDHAPIIISTTGSVVTPTALSRPWRSEAHWLQGPECDEVIKMGWAGMGRITGCWGVIHKLSACRHHLKTWSRSLAHLDRKQGHRLESQIREIKRGPISLESRRKEADLWDKLDAWYARQELYWQQRRKIH
ncbi:UNVERIFIED_CONTAM: hypothetical protein Sradi_5495100 [Sesamum radiatum]|uniref:Endonuclease/exonuclease/phosphatase domain-containing protein n=1 Tax=Sesamum radiatum TaxID=300843 RepID=A0AAW2LAM0_SESRA